MFGGPLDEDRVGREQGVIFLDDRLELVEERRALLQPAAGQVGRRAAGREVAVGQPGAAGFLEQVEDFLALAEGIQERAERAEVEAVGPHADEVAGDAAHLGDDHAQVAGLLGKLVVEQLLDAQRPAEIHVHPGQVVHPVGVGNPLPRREVLADLLGTAVQVADVRLDLARRSRRRSAARAAARRACWGAAAPC